MNKKLALIAFCAALVACTSEPPNPAAESGGPAAAEPAPSPDSAAPAVDLVDNISFSAENGAFESKRFGSQSGEFVDGRLVNGGKAGYLLFGPYVAFGAGTYRAEFQGEVQSLAPGSKVRLDASSNKGKSSHGGVDVTEAGELPAFEFTLGETIEDLEVRVRAPEGSQVSLRSYDVSKVR